MSPTSRSRFRASAPFLLAVSSFVPAVPARGQHVLPMKGPCCEVVTYMPGGPATPTKWLGTKEMAVVLIDLTDSEYLQGQTLEEAYAEVRERIFTGSTSLNAFWKEASYDKFDVVGHHFPDGDVFGPVDVPYDSSSCDRQAWASAAEVELEANPAFEFDSTNYDLIAFAAKSPCGSVGLPSYDPPGAYLDNFSLRATSHEMGHGLGYSHSSSYICENAAGQPVTYGDDCIHDEYGDIFDTMGGPNWNTMTYNQQKRGQVGWLDPGDTTTATGTGFHTLYPIESTGSNVKVLRVPRVSGPGGVTEEYYYIELRYPIGFDVGHPSGAAYRGTLIRLAKGYNRMGRSFLLDARPETGTFFEAPFVPETGPAVFEDTSTGTRIETHDVMVGPDVNSTFATVKVVPGTVLACSYGAPVLNVSPSSLSMLPGETAAIDVAIFNGDSADCPPVPMAVQFVGVPENWGNEALIDFEKQMAGQQTWSTIRHIKLPDAQLDDGEIDVVCTNLYTGMKDTVHLSVDVL